MELLRQNWRFYTNRALELIEIVDHMRSNEHVVNAITPDDSLTEKVYGNSFFILNDWFK